MKQVEKRGVSVAAVIESFCHEVKLRPEQLKYEIIQQPSNGLFGLFGKKEAVVVFSIQEMEEKIEAFASRLLELMGIPFRSITVEKQREYYYIRLVEVKDAGVLIGKEGRFLESLQHIINRAFDKNSDTNHIFVDVDGYRERQENKLIQKVMPLFNKVKRSKKSITLDLMSPAERRIIHQFVEKDPELRTLTVGEGKLKRIVIFPQNGEETQHNRPERPERSQNAPRKRAKPEGEPRKEEGETPRRNNNRNNQYYSRRRNNRPNTNGKPKQEE